MASEVETFTVHDQAPAVGLMVHDLPLPEDCLVVAIRRGEDIIVPHGPTQLVAGDQIIFHGTRDRLATLNQLKPRLFDADPL